MNIPINQNDRTPIIFLRNNTDIGFGTTVLRMFRKRKHFANEYAPGQRPVEGVAEFIGNVTMDAATELYYVLVNDRYASTWYFGLT